LRNPLSASPGRNVVAHQPLLPNIVDLGHSCWKKLWQVRVTRRDLSMDLTDSSTGLLPFVGERLGSLQSTVLAKLLYLSASLQIARLCTRTRI
jgi:hypothetical protein